MFDESFIAQITAQFATIGSVLVTGHLRTSNPVLTNSLNAIATAFLSIAVGYLVKFLFRSGWRNLVRYLNPGCMHPTQFNPEGIVAPKDHYYSVSVQMHNEKVIFCTWFLKYNSDKIRKGTIEVSEGLEMYTKMSEQLAGKSSEKFDYSYTAAYNLHKGLAEPVPIWWGSDGEMVFAQRSEAQSQRRRSPNDEDDEDDGGAGIRLFSKSHKALEEVARDIQVNSPSSSRLIKGKELYVMEYKVRRMGRETDVYNKRVGVVNPVKTFDKLFFREKDNLVRLLTQLMNGTMYPARVGKENRLGLLLSGPPGTGKTSTIQAICNFTGRNLVKVDMSIIKTRTAFDRIMSDNSIEENVFVFEEFDEALKVVKRRDGKASEKEAKQCDEKVAMVQALSAIAESTRFNREPQGKNDEDDQITLGYLLEKLDGYASSEGRILVATTNHPQLIDDALKRDGRFGMEIRFTYCDSGMLLDIVGLFCDLSEEARSKLAKLVDISVCDKWTPTEVLEVCCIQKTPEAILEYLRSHKPSNR